MPASRALVRSLICSAEWFMSLIYRRPWWPQAPSPGGPDERYDGVAVPFQIEGDAVFVATNEELSEQGRPAIHGESRAVTEGGTVMSPVTRDQTHPGRQVGAANPTLDPRRLERRRSASTKTREPLARTSRAVRSLTG